MSDKTLAERLQVKRGRRLAVIGAPAGLALDGLALDGADAVPAEADIVLAFAPDRAWLEHWLASALPTLRPDALLWVAYVKLTSPRAGDLSRDVIRALVPGYGLDTVAQIAIDADWSALRLRRVPPT